MDWITRVSAEGRAVRRAVARFAGQAAVVLLVTFTLLMVLEGAASVRVVSGMRGNGVVKERAHTEFDSELGWINERSVHVRDLYGPGLDLTTNSERFRSRHDFSKAVPAGKLRAICAGDSFTLGYGVSDDDPWCELLQRKDDRLETVNMGQGGYGVDQAYLWYRRDGLALDHDVLVFAAIGGDFERMLATTFSGYPKPLLTIRDGRVVSERKLSRLRYVLRGLGQRWENLGHLRSMELWHSLRAKPGSGTDVRELSTTEGRTLLLAMVDDLVRTLAPRKTSMIFVLLPTLSDYRDRHVDEWESFLAAELGRRGVPFLDLVSAFRREEPEAAASLLHGHFNEAGNQWAADRIYAALSELPGVRERLGGAEDKSRSTPALFDAPSVPRLQALAGFAVRSNRMSDAAPLLVDGSLSTRWTSAAMQDGTEELVVDLGMPVPVRRVTLKLGEWAHDAARGLALDVASNDGSFHEVLRARGDIATATNIEGVVDAQVMALPESVEARYLRIRQTSSSADNYWSVAELEVFRAP